MKQIFALAICAGVFGCDAGDEASVRNRAMDEMADAMNAANSSVIIAPAATPAQRALLVQNLVEHKTTYDVLSASPKDLNLLQDIRGLIHDVKNDHSLGSQELARIMTRTEGLKSIGVEAIGRLPDAGRRESVLFRFPTGKLGMLSIWDYEADKGKVFALADAQRFEVAGHSAALSLSENENDSRRLWALGWAAGAEYYSLYLEDAATKESDTQWNPKRIRAFAEEITR